MDVFSSNTSFSNGIGMRKKPRQTPDDEPSSTRIGPCESMDMQKSLKSDKFPYMLKCTDDDSIPTLLDLSAKSMAEHYTFQQLEEKYDGPIPECIQKRVLFWSFPRDERPIRLYSIPSSNDHQEEITENWRRSSTSSTNSSISTSTVDGNCFHAGEMLLENNCVEDALQIGSHLSGMVKSTFMIEPFKVSMSFDRCKITSVKCNCDHKGVYWCQHVVALALYRIRYPDRVQLCLPISESLNQMDREQLQKFAQYLISKHYTEILPTAQHLVDEVLKSNSQINAIHGAPDPTAGPPDDDPDDHCWYMDTERMRSYVRCSLNHTSSGFVQVSQLFAKIKSMLRQRDSNGPKLLSLITDRFLEHLWVSTVLHGPAYVSPIFSEKCQNLWDQLGSLWVCIVLNPYSKSDRRQEWIQSLRKWIAHSSCPAENAFSLPNDLFCNAHICTNPLPGVDNLKQRTVFHLAIETSHYVQWTHPMLNRILNSNFTDLMDPSKKIAWSEYLPWACARADTLRTHGYIRESICLSVATIRNLKMDKASKSDERWLGNPFDPINIVFDCLMEAPLEIDADTDLIDLCVDLAMDTALMALSQSRHTGPTCVYKRQKSMKQETALLEKLKKIKVDDRLLESIKRLVNLIFPNIHGGQKPSANSVPTHSLANYLFQVFLPRDPDLAYGVALQALQSPSENGVQDDLDPIFARSWKASQACARQIPESSQCSLALNLMISAKDDCNRLRYILKAIRANVRSTMMIYRLAQDVQREAQIQPDGSTTKRNLLVASFELGLHVLSRTISVNGEHPNWFRADLIRWSVSCSSMLGYDAMISLTDEWESFFSSQEATGTVGPMIWKETFGPLFRFDNIKRESISQSVHRLAWECVSRCPGSCALQALNLCENDPISFESVYLLILDAGQSGRIKAEELFNIGRYMERLSLAEKAYQIALLALANTRICHAEESTPLITDVYWMCGLAHSMGPIQMSSVINMIVDRIHCATVLADILKRCAYPPMAAFAANSSPASMMATISVHPDLRRLLAAAMQAYTDTIRSRLCHISPRHYGEFLDFLTKAKDTFALHEDGYRLFKLMLDQVKQANKGKKKLVALIEYKFNF